MEDFIGIFPDAASKEYCEKVINRFDYLQEVQGTTCRRGKIWTRQETNEGPSTLKEDNAYFLGGLGGDDFPFKEEDKILMDTDAPLLKEFSEITWICYDRYVKKYGFLSDLSSYKMQPSVKIQKTKTSQGYHVWHSDNGNLQTSRRIIVVTLYLNTVEEGGETEFLYQSTRVSPVQGTIVLWPAGWTHPHRGNPPLKGNKYIITAWFEFIE